MNKNNETELGPLRSGRMIYEWITMAEKDLVIEAHKYKYIVRSDITNFYNSVYTHSIAWALHGTENAFEDRIKRELTGSKIDRLVQYANESRTNGIPVGPVVSDLIAEIILSCVDLNVSRRLKKVDFIATRFKDDYRILCNSERDARNILKTLSDELSIFNLLINESKTKILNLPNGLYRQHNRKYISYSLKNNKEITFQEFEYTLLKVLDIHENYPGTSLIEKFLSELYKDDFTLKLKFSDNIARKKQEIYKTYSLLSLAQRKSEKILSHVLAVIEIIYKMYEPKLKLKLYTENFIKSKILYANKKKSIFELIWYIYFSRHLGLGVSCCWVKKKINSKLRENLLLESIITSEQKFFKDTQIKLFVPPEECEERVLAKSLAIFDRSSK